MAEKMTINKLANTLTSFGLKHSAHELPDLLDLSLTEEWTNREFLVKLLDVEIAGRNERRRGRNYAAAHFPTDVKTLEMFDVLELESGITTGQIQQLKELNWVENHTNVLLFGEPGLGKTMIAMGLCLHAINVGYTVCIEKMSNLIGLMDRAPYERAAGFRIKNIRKAQIVCLDECGYTPIDRTQANNLFNFISDCYRNTSFIVTTNKRIDQWTEVLGDEALVKALWDRLIQNSLCFTLFGTSYRLKHPQAY